MLSRDAEVFRVLRATLEKLSIEIEVCQEAKKASDILISQKFDAVIVDCDDMPGGVGVLEGLRATPSNKSSVTFAIVNERTSTQEAFGMGVNFVLHKPLSVLNTSRCFNAALSFMLRERRRYFRHPVKMPVCLVLDGKEIKGESTNISEGGIALLLQHALPKNAAPRLQFTLPASGPALDVDTQVAWADLKGYVGLRFVNLPASSQELLEGWLTTQMERQTSGPTDILAAPTPRAIQ